MEGLDLGRIRQAVHHVGNTTLFEAFRDGFPAVLYQFGSISSVNSLFQHAVVAKYRTGLQHATKDSLFAHQVGFHFGNKGRLQNTGTVTAGGSGIGFGDLQTITVRVILPMYGNQCRYAETTFVFFTYLSTWAFRRNHDDGQVITDLHAFFNNIETMGVGQTGAFFHQRHDLLNHRRVLLVRGQVQYQIGFGNQFFKSADSKGVISGIDPGLALFLDGCCTQGVADIQTTVAHVQSLIETLGTTAKNHDFFTFQFVDTS